MHTAPVPSNTIENWLESNLTENANYGHALLEQKNADFDSLSDELRPYFESAHLDARKYFHDVIGIDLHPDAADIPAVGHAVYPERLPTTARRGLFGEVMAGMISEHYPLIGKHKWVVPVFLFRHHGDVKQYLFDLVRDAARKRQVFGRPGSDFLGISLDASGNVERYIVGEAKWREKLSDLIVEDLVLGSRKTDKKTGKVVRKKDGIWTKFNTDLNIPLAMRDLQHMLQELDPVGMAKTILSIDKALLIKGALPLKRTNLVVICGNSHIGRQPLEVYIDWKTMPSAYTAPHDLQVVEVVMENGEELIDKIYEKLWKGPT